MAWFEFANESTENLIEYIRWREQPSYTEIANDAFIAFCFRFRDDVQKSCRIIAGKRGFDDTVGDEIAEKTFARFLRYPKYNHAKCKCGDIDTCVKLYLYRFAGRLLSDYLKNERLGSSPFTGEEDIVTDFPDIEEMILPVETKTQLLNKQNILNKAFERLSPKHKIIYLTYKQYESEQREGYYLPRNLLKRLQDELQLTQGSIRKYKEEANKKVAEYIEIYGAR